MAPAPIPPVGAPGAPAPAPAASARPADGFAEAVTRGVQQVSDAERAADAAALDVATGGSTGIHDLMASTAKAQLGVDLLVQVRNRAIEAYQEIMRIQV